MTNLVKIDRLFKNITCPLILGAGKISHGRTIEKIDELNFSLTGVVAAPSQKLTLRMIDSKEFAYYMAGEANRFFLASMISLSRAKYDESENLSWQIVEHYYSAYYALHYLIRISGLSLTNIDKPTLRMILRSNMTGCTYQNLESGLNIMSYDQLCESVTLEKKEKKGGSHIDAWASWVSVVERLLQEANSDIEEYAESAVSLSEHLGFIKRSNDTFSPTVIRNEVNYQFINNAWCFDGLTREKISRIRRAITQDDIILKDRGDLLESLVCNNNFIISLAKKVFFSASDNYSKSICRSLLHKYKRKIATLS
ncbi:hypothetical protein EFS38_17460 [Dickeya undicola]|uniref:Uncharacterized protein n=1 Tax=Dickeya undicola TaxID=1577887 RepID=A0ABX9WR47_9GAMM|nr:hypothetical protein [Dickeya undicola]RNM20698.1 hypothetical protein EFS38_17460 [Dickeya undicola]